MDITSEHRNGEITVFVNSATPEVQLTTRREEAKATVKENEQSIITVAENIESVKDAAQYVDTFDDVIASLPQIMEASTAAKRAEKAEEGATEAKDLSVESASIASASASSATLSAQKASESETKALASEQSAQNSANSASESKTSAQNSALLAAESATSAKQDLDSIKADAEMVAEYAPKAIQAAESAEIAKASAISAAERAEQASQGVEGALADKQDKLTAGEGIKIEGNVISTEGGTSVPDNVYTQTNLLGGKDIEIVPEPVEGGIDGNTVAVWHFDGDTNWIDDRGTVYQTDFSYQNLTLKTDFKFGTGSAGAPNYAGAKFSCATLEKNYGMKRLNMNSSFTLDFWFLFGDNYESSTSTSNFGFTGSSNGLYWSLVKDLTKETTFQTNVDGVAYQTKFVPTEKGLIKNTWHHIAMEYYVKDDSTGTSTFFIDGNPVASIDFTVGTSAVLDTFQFGGRGGQIFDEFRISNIARYKGQPFTPPTKAYEVAEPTGNMVVNFVGEKLQKGADYVVESYNDGANWYRVYKSGWIEQGGNASTIANITLLKPMKDTNYTVIGVQNGTTAPSSQEGSPRAGAISNTQVYVVGGASWQSVNYYVCGQGA